MLEKDPSSNTAVSQYYFAAVHASAGDLDEALASLEKAFDFGFRDFAVLEVSEYFSSLRGDPRFAELVGRHRE